MAKQVEPKLLRRAQLGCLEVATLKMRPRVTELLNTHRRAGPSKGRRGSARGEPCAVREP